MFGKKTFGAIFILLLAYSYNAYQSQNKIKSPVIETSVGKIQGIVSESRGGKKFYEFLGIPYAQPPVNELRFMSPKPIEVKWNGIRDASNYGSECAQLQLITGGFSGKEDCLYLNIFAHEISKEPKNLLPVMVFLHGGAFITGSSNGYRPSYLMDEDVILVTVNYRLAALGFLNTGDGIVRGNMGLKDQVMALKWVQRNIKFFGGNPDQVTLFGESAGSSSANFQILSSMSKGLFSRAILQSGTATSNWSIFKEPEKQAKRYATKFGCPTDNTKEMVQCLKKIDTETFVKGHEEVLVPFREQFKIFTPTLETIKDEDAFLTEDPLEILKSGKFNSKPLILGGNEGEGLLSSSIITSNQTKLDQINNDFHFFASRTLNYPEDKKSVSEKIRKHYFGKLKNIATDELVQNYTNLFSDRQFFVPLHRLAKNYANDVPMYLYYFSYQGDFSFSRILASTQKPYLPVIASVLIDMAVRWVKVKVFKMDVPHPGVCHADELPYFFDWPLSPTIKPTSDDYTMSKDLVRLWTLFAKNEKILKFRGVEWKQTKPSDSKLKYLQIDKVPAMIDEPFWERIQFWNTIDV